GGLKWKLPEDPKPDSPETSAPVVEIAPPAAAPAVSAQPSALIYPNPADKLVSVTLEPGVRTSAQAVLYAPDGKILKKAVIAPLQTETFELPAPGCSPYLMELKVEGQTYVKRVWVKTP
ncbi:MAG: T9SS type A sorting domain-containing protein, partial [Bacteroidia bacterium]|nr:T9SS type A sorting domain-containing protein [Bacteroidia bacterium]